MTSPAILVIDDDHSVHEIVEAALSRTGIHCIFAITAEDGIQLTHEHQPQLILMDLLLPSGMKGPEAIAILKSDDATRHIPIVAFTAATGHYIKQAMQAGADDFIIKPFSMPQFQRTVKQYLSAIHG